MELTTELRNADLNGLVDLLRKQDEVKVDEVVSASRLYMQDGRLHIVGGAQDITADGVTAVDAVLDCLPGFDDGLSDKLGIPRAYLRKLRDTGRTVTVEHRAAVTSAWGAETQPAGTMDLRLLDLNVNGWLQENPTRRFLVRSFRTDDPHDVGIARALLSDAFARYDHLDVLLSALAGVRDAGKAVTMHRCSLTERQMRVTFTCPDITAMAPELLANYRSPYAPERTGRALPVVEAGLDIRNSETGGGALILAPYALFQVCTNGMTRQVDAIRKAHLGVRLDEGVVAWSADTTHKAAELVKAQARDAVQTFLNPEYLQRWVDDITGKAVQPVANAVDTIQRVAKVHAFTEQEQADILDCFIKSGDLTAGGVMQAVTAAAQHVESPDRQAELEDVAMAVLDTAVAVG